MAQFNLTRFIYGNTGTMQSALNTLFIAVRYAMQSNTRIGVAANINNTLHSTPVYGAAIYNACLTASNGNTRQAQRLVKLMLRQGIIAQR